MKKKISPQKSFATEVIESFDDFFSHVAQGRPVTVRSVRVDLRPRKRSPREIARLRQHVLGVSQGVMAKLLGVSPVTIQSWEQGLRKPSVMALRFLDEIADSPEHFKSRLFGANKRAA